LLLKYDIIKAAGLEKDFKNKLFIAAKETSVLGFTPKKKSWLQLTGSERNDWNKACTLSCEWSVMEQHVEPIPFYGWLPVEQEFIKILLDNLCLKQDLETKVKFAIETAHANSLNSKFSDEEIARVGFGEAFYKGEDNRKSWVKLLRTDADLAYIAEINVRGRIPKLEEELAVQKARLSFVESLNDVSEE
jgi:hypothetical protein